MSSINNYRKLQVTEAQCKLLKQKGKQTNKQTGPKMVKGIRPQEPPEPDEEKQRQKQLTFHSPFYLAFCASPSFFFPIHILGSYKSWG